MFFERLARFFARRPFGASILFGLLSAAMVLLATRVEADFTVQELFATDDPQIAVLEAFRARFGADDDVLLFALEAPDVLSPAALKAMRALTAALKRSEHLRRVRSLTTVTDLGTEDFIDARPLFGELPSDEAALRALQQRALKSPLIGGRLVAKDRSVALVIGRLAKGIERSQQMEEAVAALKKLVRGVKLPPGARLELAGVPVVRTVLVQSLRADQLRFVPLSALITTLLLLLLYRQLVPVLVAMGSTGLSVAYTLGLMRLLDRPLDILSNVLPILVMVYGVADAVHMLSRHREARREGLDMEEATRLMMRHLGVACLITSTTTAAGFFSLVSSEMHILQRLGLLAAAGVMLAYLVSMVVVPLGLTLAARRRDGKLAAPRPSGRAQRHLGALAERVARHPRALLITAVLLALGAVALGTHVPVDNYLLGTLPEDHAVTKLTKRLGRKLQGVVAMHVALDGGERDALKESPALKAMAALQRWVAKEPGVTGTLSAADFVAELHRAAIGHRAIPSKKEAVAQLLLLAEGETGIERTVDFEFWHGRIEINLRDVGARAYLPLVARLQTKADTLFAGTSIRAHVTGTSFLAYRGIDRLVWSLLKSLALALGAIVLILSITFRSLKLGLITLVPNLIPLTMGLAFMALTGMYLEPTTVMVYSIAFGIAVDDTIHFIARYREEVGRGATTPNAVKATIRSTGRAMVLTSIVLMSGFAVVLVSHFPGTQRFGVLGLVIIASALVTDLLVTPATLLVFRTKAEDHERRGVDEAQVRR